MSVPEPLRPHLVRSRLRAERAMIHRLNRGHGFTESHIPSQIYLRDSDARERMGRDELLPQDTHLQQAAEVDAALNEINASLDLHRSTFTDLCERMALTSPEAVLLELALAYQLDTDMRTLCDAMSGRRNSGLDPVFCRELAPELGDITDLLAIIHPNRMLRRSQLITMEDSDVLASTPLVASRRIVDWLLGDSNLPSDLASAMHLARPNTITYLTPDTLERLEHVAARLRATIDDDLAPIVLIQGPQGAGKGAAASHLARALNMPLAIAPIAKLMDRISHGDHDIVHRVLAEAQLRGALIYVPGVQLLDADGSNKENTPGGPVPSTSIIETIAASSQLVITSTRERGKPSAPFRRPFHLVDVPRPDLSTRRNAWSAGIAELAPDLTAQAATDLAARYVVGPGTISDVLHEADTFARASGEDLTLEAIEQAVGRRLTMRLGSYGRLVSRRATFDQMVLPEDVVDTLRDMIAMVRQRSTILESWGYGRHLGISRGVSALFSGEPGTGKTMAASVISGELGVELIRIDLSAVVSKWVGETEKHLSKIFDEAQNANAMLVFDEADSLFGKRTEIKSAQDRYANLEVNYVLQRMESFDGICVLTSNLEASIDPAFLRRLNFRVRFPTPEAEERAALWRVLTPPEANLPEDTDFSRLASVFEMSGGHIKNAIVRAAVIAARDGRTLEPRDLVAGAHLEYMELGKVMPAMSL